MNEYKVILDWENISSDGVFKIIDHRVRRKKDLSR